jgi:hypothetical protein
VNGLAFIVTIMVVVLILFVVANLSENQEQAEKRLIEFAKLHGLTVTTTDDGPRLFGPLGGRSLIIERFRPDPRVHRNHLRILLSLSAPGHVYLYVKGRRFLMDAWDPETETTPALDLLFDGESHPADFMTVLSTADPLLGYKLGRAVKQIGNYPFPLLEVKAGQLSLTHNNLGMSLTQLETMITALDRFASAIERAA